MPQRSLPAPAEAVKIRFVESMPSIFEADVQYAVDEIMAMAGARIISVAPGASFGEEPKPSAMITYAVAADQPAPAPGLPVAPGEYLQEWMEDNDSPMDLVAEILGCTHAKIGDIINGRVPVTPDLANRLEQIVGIPARSWLRYEARYRADLAEIANHRANLAAATAGAVTLPVDEVNIVAAAKALSPNPNRWKDFVPTVRKVINALQSAQENP
ncbi:MAG TPA: hypothetical protein VF885_15220 [Arthrobacter sp.]